MHVCNDFSQLEGVQTNFEPKVQNFLQFILDFNTMQLSPISVCDFQLAKLGGCFVIATCRARNMEDVWSLGAIKSWTTRRQRGRTTWAHQAKKYDVVIQLAPYKLLEAFKPRIVKHIVVIDMTLKLKTVIQNLHNKVTFSSQTSSMSSF
jgi:hypothetical protein